MRAISSVVLPVPAEASTTQAFGERSADAFARGAVVDADINCRGHAYEFPSWRMSNLDQRVQAIAAACASTRVSSYGPHTAV